MLKDVTSQIEINGFLTEDINISRDVRQGDSLSALLYVLIAEALWQLNRIKSKRKGNNNSRYRAKDFAICR